MDGYNSISRELIEVSEIFEFSYMKKAKLLVFPALLKYFIPALITSTGLAWKSEIAAEIITYTKNSIGASISDGKYFLDTPLVFAWTLIVVIFSLLLEALTKLLLRRCNNGTKD
jgi:NitT/TauT family transport system permease protein